MAKLSLIAAPKFKAKSMIPIAGGSPVSVEFEFKHRTKKELSEFVNSRQEKTDSETFMAMVSGWELADEFTPENIEQFLDSYIGAALAVYRTYIDELVQAKEKN